MTECNPTTLEFQDLDARKVLAEFEGGRLTSKAGALVLGEAEVKFGFVERFATGFTD
jgi:hypothetical protein